MSEDKYKTGEILHYHEDFEIDKVEVLENNSDSEWIKYKLKVLSIVQESKIFKPSDIGDIFTCEKKRGMYCDGMWYLGEVK